MTHKTGAAAPHIAGGQFVPKFVSVLREGYSLAAFRADAVAGLTVAIVALPLSMAIAIASGVSPERGLYTAIVGGFLVSLLGGSRFQIGGPAGAFIVLVAASVARHGVEGLLLATFLSGIILMLAGWCRLGTFIKYIPYPVTVGFTAGIAVIIFASQITDILGLRHETPEPGPLLPKLQALYAALPSFTPAAAALAFLSAAIILLVRRFRPHLPGMLIAIAVASVAAFALGLPVETIGSRFGGIPGGLPMPALLDLSPEKIIAVLPDALGFAFLGSIESLLSAVVADSMTGRRHRSNGELVAQGVANMASPLFGGFCVTGTIARTATNIRSGAHGPVAGMLHALFLLGFMLVAAPLAAYVPLAALGGLLAIVAWNMAERHEFATLTRASIGDAVVLLATFLLTIFHDLMAGITAGVVISAALIIHRMSEAIAVERGEPLFANGPEEHPAGDAARDPDIMLFRISGAFFFGAAAKVAAQLDEIGERPRAYVLDFSEVSYLDSTGAATIHGFVRKAARRGAPVYLAGTNRRIRAGLMVQGVRPPKVRFRSNAQEALSSARARIAGEEGAG